MTIQELRKQRNLTQSTLANLCDCSVQQIQKLEQQKFPFLFNCSFRLCHALWVELILHNDYAKDISLEDFVTDISFNPAVFEGF